MLDSAVERFGDSIYSFRKTDSGWAGISYRETRDSAQAIARGLLALGVERGQALALIAEGSPEWIVSEYGALYAGCTCVPLSFRLLPEEIPFRMNHSSSRVIFLSRISLDSVLAIYSQLESRPFLVYLDDDVDHFRERIEAIGLSMALERGNAKKDAQTTSGAEINSAGRGVSFAALKALGKGQPNAAVEENLRATSEDDVVTISYTSGTTGNPKGIMLTHLNYFANSRDALESFQVPPHYRTLVILPCDHSFAHTVGIYAGLAVSMSLYFVDSRGGGMGILRNIPVNLLETEPDFLLTVPAISGNFMKKIISGVEERGAFVSRLFKRGIEAGIAYHGDCWNRPPLNVRLKSFLPYKLADILVFRKVRSIFGKNIKFFIGGGALLEIGQQRFFKALGLPVYQGYGLTEAAPVISTNAPGRHKLGSSGKLIPNLECRIIDEEGNDLPDGALGQILVRGDNVMKGYFRNPDETARTLREGWLHTGDRGYLDSDGFLIVTGREKALLISEDGEKYSPEEIEEAIVVAAETAITQVMLYNDHRKYTSALIVPDREILRRRFGSAATPEELLSVLEGVVRQFRSNPGLKSRFPAQWIPSTFAIVSEPFSLDNGLMNSTSKVVRYKVEERYRELIEYLYTPDGSRPHNERNLQSLAGSSTETTQEEEKSR